MKNLLNGPQKCQEIRFLCQKILNGKQQNHSHEIEAILNGTSLKEFDVLKEMSKELKITPENIDKIYSNSYGFEILQKACEIYIEIIDESTIKQQNFLNIFVLQYLLTNLDSMNIELLAVYSNLFIVDMDLFSFYQIILSHCYGLPKSVINLTLFLKEFNGLQGNNELTEKTLISCFRANQFQWETNKVKDILNKCKNNEPIEGIIKPSNRIVECIWNDDVDEFRRIQLKCNFDCDSSFGDYSEANFWPFQCKFSMRMINLAAFFGSTKIFKLLLLNHAYTTNELIDFAIAGGNSEIIHTCLQYNHELTLNSFQMAIRYYHNDILAWIIENNQDLFRIHKEEIFNYSIKHSNPDAFLMLLDNGCDFTFININLFKTFVKEWMKVVFVEESFFNKIKNRIKESFKNYYYWTYDGILRFAEYFLRERKDLEQIKKNSIIPPIPNKLIFDFIYKYEKKYYFIQLGAHSKEFFLYLAKNNLINTFNSIYSICEESIKVDDTYFLTEMGKYDKNIPNIVSSILLPLSIRDIRIIHNQNICKYIFENIYADTKSNNLFCSKNLSYACFYNDIQMIDYLLNRKCIDVNYTGFKRNESPIILAVESNNISIVHLLLKDKRVDINLFCEDHKTALYYACEYNYPEIADMLLEDVRIDINIPDKNGKTPFAIACEKGNNYIVKRILERNDADLNTLSNDGSPFGLAVKNWKHKTVKILIDCKRIRFQNENEENPLHQACLHGNLKMVELLFTIDSNLLNKNVIDDIKIIKLT